MKHRHHFHLTQRGWACHGRGFRHEVYQCECGRTARFSFNLAFFNPDTIDRIMSGETRQQLNGGASCQQ